VRCARPPRRIQIFPPTLRERQRRAFISSLGRRPRVSISWRNSSAEGAIHSSSDLGGDSRERPLNRAFSAIASSDQNPGAMHQANLSGAFSAQRIFPYRADAEGCAEARPAYAATEGCSGDCVTRSRWETITMSDAASPIWKVSSSNGALKEAWRSRRKSDSVRAWRTS
jgi:hypothetical protein